MKNRKMVLFILLIVILFIFYSQSLTTIVGNFELKEKNTEYIVIVSKFGEQKEISTKNYNWVGEYLIGEKYRVIYSYSWFKKPQLESIELVP